MSKDLKKFIKDLNHNNKIKAKKVAESNKYIEDKTKELHHIKCQKNIKEKNLKNDEKLRLERLNNQTNNINKNSVNLEKQHYSKLLDTIVNDRVIVLDCPEQCRQLNNGQLIKKVSFELAHRTTIKTIKNAEKPIRDFLLSLQRCEYIWDAKRSDKPFGIVIRKEDEKFYEQHISIPNSNNNLRAYTFFNHNTSTMYIVRIENHIQNRRSEIIKKFLHIESQGYQCSIPFKI